MEDKFVLNLDAPEDDPSPLKLRRDRGAQKTYKRRAPHAAEIEQLTAFVRYLFPSYTIAGICGTEDKWRMQVWLETLAAEYLWMRDLRIA